MIFLIEHVSLSKLDYRYIVRWHYNAVSFLPNPHNIDPIAHPWGQDMGCLLWVDTLIYVVLQTALTLSWHSAVLNFGPSDAIWRQKSGSTLAQLMAWCLTAPSHYLNQCWLIISEVQWHSHQGNFTRDASTTNHQNLFKNYMSKIVSKFSRG